MRSLRNPNRKYEHLLKNYLQLACQPHLLLSIAD
jgi:hypothetical protein